MFTFLCMKITFQVEKPSKDHKYYCWFSWQCYRIRIYASSHERSRNNRNFLNVT